MRFLVVEDEAGIADFVQRGLHAEGHQVDVTGRRAELERLDGAWSQAGRAVLTQAIRAKLPRG